MEGHRDRRVDVWPKRQCGRSAYGGRFARGQAVDYVGLCAGLGRYGLTCRVGKNGRCPLRLGPVRCPARRRPEPDLLGRREVAREQENDHQTAHLAPLKSLLTRIVDLRIPNNTAYATHGTLITRYYDQGPGRKPDTAALAPVDDKGY